MPQKNILIIGGGSGIGKAIIEDLIDKGDSQIYAASRSINEADLPDKVTKIKYDVMADDSLEGLPEQIHGLVYCPGTINLQPFHRFKIEDIRQEMELNLMGAIKVVQSLFKRLKASGNASVVFFSTVAVQQGLPFHSSVSAAKGAIEGLTRSLAAEYAPQMRFNAIAPSLTDTPLAAGLLSNDRKRESNADRNPLKKIGTPRDLAKMASYLLSDDSAWVTGQIMKVDGGMSSIRPL
jgi:NAD(P)-dependent dehydrogenase (short-subunit alcohol dehydrogenase family)